MDDIEKLSGSTARNELLARAEKFICSADMIQENNFLKLTRKGRLFADRITADLFF
jgi:coproporphyrinogen III oxidase-like Fe-S oxidoreductase